MDCTLAYVARNNQGNLISDEVFFWKCIASYDGYGTVKTRFNEWHDDVHNTFTNTMLSYLANLPKASSILSHSSRMKCFRCFRLSFLDLTSARILPGVPTTMCGQLFLRTASSLAIDRPPKKTPTFGKAEVLQLRH